MDRCPWNEIVAYAADQSSEIAAGRGLRRSEAVNERYRRYSSWCTERGHTGVELVLAISIWCSVAEDDVHVALEPNIVPYHTEEPIEHWILWYHPEFTNGSTDLDHQRAREHVQQFISLHNSELAVFQNLPQFRSVPEIAHCHVFIRPKDDASRDALEKLRRERRLRSPWVEAERLGGRGREVGF